MAVAPTGQVSHPGGAGHVLLFRTEAAAPTYLPTYLPVAPTGQVSHPGGAGHALLFRNHVIVKKDFKVCEGEGEGEVREGWAGGEGRTWAEGEGEG